MITVAEVTEQLIKRSPFLEEALADGLINISSLARHLQPEIEKQLKKEVKSGAIVMAVNRLAPAISKKAEARIDSFVSNIGDIVVRSDLTDYTYANSDTLIKKQSQLLNIVGKEKDLFCTSSQGVYEATIVVSSSIKDRIEKIFMGEHLLGSTSNLASITIKLPKGNTAVSGIYYYITKKIAWEGIPIVEVISTTNEFTLVMNDKDINRTFGILMGLKK
jgi:hypothetical protein